mmetsp:Transcript_4087/g.10186  ORF Transcript_4087/g.10186 Transcript_4087/m.10186 type:complete len:257 (+) Transcript_4087:209-979(+)
MFEGALRLPGLPVPLPRSLVLRPRVHAGTFWMHADGADGHAMRLELEQHVPRLRSCVGNCGLLGLEVIVNNLAPLNGRLDLLGLLVLRRPSSFPDRPDPPLNLLCSLDGHHTQYQVLRNALGSHDDLLGRVSQAWQRGVPVRVRTSRVLACKELSPLLSRDRVVVRFHLRALLEAHPPSRLKGRRERCLGFLVLAPDLVFLQPLFSWAGQDRPCRHRHEGLLLFLACLRRRRSLLHADQIIVKNVATSARRPREVI